MVEAKFPPSKQAGAVIQEQNVDQNQQNSVTDLHATSSKSSILNILVRTIIAYPYISAKIVLMWAQFFAFVTIDYQEMRNALGTSDEVLQNVPTVITTAYSLAIAFEALFTIWITAKMADLENSEMQGTTWVWNNIQAVIWCLGSLALIVLDMIINYHLVAFYFEVADNASMYGFLLFISALRFTPIFALLTHILNLVLIFRYMNQLSLRRTLGDSAFTGKPDDFL